MRKLLMTLLLAGCGHTGGFDWDASNRVVGPAGPAQSAWIVSCRHGLQGCYDDAAERCPMGYDVYDSSGKSRYVAMGTTVIEKRKTEMLVQCKPPQVAAH